MSEKTREEWVKSWYRNKTDYRFYPWNYVMGDDYEYRKSGGRILIHDETNDFLFHSDTSKHL